MCGLQKWSGANGRGLWEQQKNTRINQYSNDKYTEMLFNLFPNDDTIVHDYTPGPAKHRNTSIFKCKLNDQSKCTQQQMAIAMHIQ